MCVAESLYWWLFQLPLSTTGDSPHVFQQRSLSTCLWGANFGLYIFCLYTYLVLQPTNPWIATHLALILKPCKNHCRYAKLSMSLEQKYWGNTTDTHETWNWVATCSTTPTKKSLKPSWKQMCLLSRSPVCFHPAVQLMRCRGSLLLALCGESGIDSGSLCEAGNPLDWPCCWGITICGCCYYSNMKNWALAKVTVACCEN